MELFTEQKVDHENRPQIPMDNLNAGILLVVETSVERVAEYQHVTPGRSKYSRSFNCKSCARLAVAARSTQNNSAFRMVVVIIISINIYHYFDAAPVKRFKRNGLYFLTKTGMWASVTGVVTVCPPS